MFEDVLAQRKRWEVGEGDCLDLMRELPDKSVNLILCDLPYGTTACKWDVVIPFEPLWEQYKRIVKPNAAIVLTASQPFTSALVMSNPKWFRCEWIWEKDKATGWLDSKRRPLKAHENIVVFSASQSLYNPQKTTGHLPANKSYGRGKVREAGRLFHGSYISVDQGGQTDRYPRSVVKFNVASKEGKQYHPTQKPIAFMEYLIRTYSNEGDLILDNACGSGTTGLAALKTGRFFIGMEKEADYVSIARNRITEEEDRLRLTLPFAA